MKPRTGRASPARPPRTDAQAIQRLAGSRARTGSKVQQRFARLIKQVDQRKQRLRAWYDAQPAIHRDLAAYRALLEANQRTAHDLVILFDRLYTHPTFTKAERKRLRGVICEMAGDLLGEQGFDDLKPIYNRHSRSDFDAEAAFGNAVQAHAMKSMMEEMFGMDFGDADVSSPEKLQAFAEAQFQAAEEQEEQARERRARRKKSARQQAREAEREAEKSRVGKVLQEVYRKLAVALHPDLEQDPAERARKTELMQQVNVAYESQDLLRLLELQLKLEQIDADHASEVAEDRLRHYNTILDQQVKELDAELDDLEMPWRMELDLLPSAQLRPAHILEQIRKDSEELRLQSAALRRDLERFQDVAQLKKWLKAPGARRRDDDLELDLFR
ncbi:MAG TPA: J domain-containing protein [Kofleriaceae bacterium]